MLEKELHLERNLFFFLNGSDSTFWDYFFYICTYPWTWLLLYICLFWAVTYKKDWKEIVCVLVAIGLLILFCDQISSHFFKPVFHRLRPTHHPDFENLVHVFRYKAYEYRGGMYGFISGHATNAFGLATFTALIFRNKLFTGTIFLYATLVSYSRIYIGVHFISDVVVGALTGASIAVIMYLIYNQIRHNWFFIENSELKKPICSVKKTYFICGFFYLYLLLILIFNNQLITIILQNK